MNELEREDDLRAHLERRSPLQRTLTEIDRLEPPEELDRIVLSRARSAIHGDEGMPIYGSRRSSVPFALAATLVLVITLVIATRPRNAPTPVAESGARATPQMLQTNVAPEPRLAPASGTLSAPPPAASAALVDAKRAPATDRLIAARAASAPAPMPAARDATVWLRDIRELRREGRTAEAEREWSAFLKAHPEYGRAGSGH
jgi:hypothetical protein